MSTFIIEDSGDLDVVAQSLAEFIRDRWGFDRVDSDPTDDEWIVPGLVLLRAVDHGATIDSYCSRGLEPLRLALDSAGRLDP